MDISLRQRYTFEQLQLSNITTLDELDFKVLSFQNRKIFERLEFYRNNEKDLKQKIEQLEQKCNSTNSILCLFNRYWNSLDDNLKLILDKIAIEFTVERDKYQYDTETQKQLENIDILTDYDSLISKFVSKNENSIQNINEEDSQHSGTEDVLDETTDERKYGKLAKIRKMQQLEKRIKLDSSSNNSTIPFPTEFNMKFTKEQEAMLQNYFVEELFTCDSGILDQKFGDRIEFTKRTLLNVLRHIETFYIIRDHVITKQRQQMLNNTNSNEVQENMNPALANMSFENIVESVRNENYQLRNMYNVLQKVFYQENLQRKSVKDQLKLSLNANEELLNRVQDLEYELEKRKANEIKLNAELLKLSDNFNKVKRENGENIMKITALESALTLANNNSNLNANTIAISNNQNGNPNNNFPANFGMISSSNNNIIGHQNNGTNLSAVLDSSALAAAYVPIEQFKTLEYDLQQERIISSNRLTDLERLNERLCQAQTKQHYLQVFRDRFDGYVLQQTPDQNVNSSFCNNEEGINNTNKSDGIIVKNECGTTSMQTNITDEQTQDSLTSFGINQDAIGYEDTRDSTASYKDKIGGIVPKSNFYFDEQAFVKDSHDYKLLQSQFAIIFNENKQLKSQANELRKILGSVKTIHLTQMEQMAKVLEENCGEFKKEALSLQENWLKTKKELDTLRVEYDQYMATREQSMAISQETKITIANLHEHNRQLKREIMRYKKRFYSGSGPPPSHGHSSNVLSPTKQLSSHPLQSGSTNQKSENILPASLSANNSKDTTSDQNNARTYKTETSANTRNTKSSSETLQSTTTNDALQNKGETPLTTIGQSQKHYPPSYSSSTNEIAHLREELKRAQNGNRELKFLLDSYKNAPKETREKAEIIASEKRIQNDYAILEERFKRYEAAYLHSSNVASTMTIKSGNVNPTTSTLTTISSNPQTPPPINFPKKLAQAEEKIASMQKKLFDTKQEEEALLKELEVTGQAFEDMQEQNIRLLQQLREKDDANFKLMTERIKANQMTKIMKEEKDAQLEREEVLRTSNTKLSEAIIMLKEREKLLQTALQNSEHESRLRVSACDAYKLKAIDSASLALSLKSKTEALTISIDEQMTLATQRLTELERERFKAERLKEELIKLKDKYRWQQKQYHQSLQQSNLENANSNSNAAFGGGDGDNSSSQHQLTSEIMVLTEEIRTYKELMTCPSCKSNRKDALLTKCYHVFCFKCLKTRYDTRRRKCPDCAAPFGANDFHRLFLY